MIPVYWEHPLITEPTEPDSTAPWAPSCSVAGFALDLRWMNLPAALERELAAPLTRAFADVIATEHGAVVNADEGRMVGHYWLRSPELAPRPQKDAIHASWHQVDKFVSGLAKRFPRVLVVGIGGSTLGPQFVADALTRPNDHRTIHFLDNTDPDGMARVLHVIAPLSDVLTVVISKSGGTAETRNGMLIVREAYLRAGLDFEKHAVAVTQSGSALDKVAANWLARFPMWDWVGGRTSVTSVVGLLPAALQGVDIAHFLGGAAAMDAWTREARLADNPAALLALAWYHVGNGRGDRAMVVLPYKDRLMLLSKYLQQLIMESLGKRLDRQGALVHQGLVVYGNKGSTDQHAYVQQLRDGRDDFFATFIEVLEDGRPNTPEVAFEVEPTVTAGDFLSGFLAGTRSALSEAGRPSVTITLPWVDEATIGAVIALFERAVSIYASLIDVNAYHQPGVEAGKVAATRLLDLQKRLVEHLAAGRKGNADELAVALSADPRDAFHILRHLAANGRIASDGEGLGRTFASLG